MVEPDVGQAEPDLLTLQAREDRLEEADRSPQLSRDDDSAGAVLLAAPPVLVQDLGPDHTKLRRRIVVHSEWQGDRVVAVIELVSPGNKASRTKAAEFVDKATSFVGAGIHLLVIDLHPATGPVPEGFHGLICEALGHRPPELPRDKGLQLVSYQVRDGGYPRAYVRQVGVGEALPDMPLFLLPHHFLPIPLERTYGEALPSLAEKFRQVLVR